HEVTNYAFPKTWRADREQRACIIGERRRCGWPSVEWYEPMTVTPCRDGCCGDPACSAHVRTWSAWSSCLWLSVLSCCSFASWPGPAISSTAASQQTFGRRGANA